MKKIFILMIAAGCFCIMGCKRYKTDFPPPSDFAGITDLFPLTVDSEPMVLTVSGLDQGIAYAYKGIGSIWVYRSNDELGSADYFDNRIIPLFDNFASVRLSNINGRRQICAKGDEGCAVGWTNGKWVFLIRSRNQKGLKKLIQAFPWIEN